MKFHIIPNVLSSIIVAITNNTIPLNSQCDETLTNGDFWMSGFIIGVGLGSGLVFIIMGIFKLEFTSRSNHPE